MRLWSLHPAYLDTKGLLALWREGLLAKKVLLSLTKGYKNHPQLDRFKAYSDPLNAIDSFLYFVYLEARNRNYNFNVNKISTLNLLVEKIPIKRGQLEFEYNHLLDKLKLRDKNRYEFLLKLSSDKISTNPLFYVIEGDIEEWEKTKKA
ncbi:pyrimidine dimer DNA glycosylase/endonuclease V [Desulfurella sp.]|uniref:pyrimidine dimer DNA glycosylase/endonuclease V n=1 Tax=Desulfurella sp. TaxID=1962857 RepID=UPI0025BBBEC8|nr:pyrimidine dimer DNA glycosylase/endonuclease V [Desulfurella sp.]